MTKPDMPVSVGLHNLRLKAGESISLDGKGNIFIVGSRGKRTDTGKNIYEKPVTFRGGPLAGDVQSIKYTVTKPYHNRKQKVHPMFSLWKGVLGLGDGPDFKPFTDETNRHLQTPSSTKLYSMLLGNTRLVANSANPDSLLYIEVRGERFFPYEGGPAKDIPLTADYVQKCQKGYRDYLTAEQKQKMTTLETEGMPEKVTKAEREYRAKREREQNRKMLEMCELEAEQRLARNDKPVISNTQALIVAGILQPNVDNLRKAEEEMDAELNKRKPSKKELSELAKKLYNEMKVRAEDKITDLDQV